MLYWAAFFFVTALAVGWYGFSGVAVAAAAMARVLFFVIVLLFLILLVTGLHTGGRNREKHSEQ